MTGSNLTDLNAAIAILMRGDPLPTDIAARLLEAGIDVSAIETKYAL